VRDRRVFHTGARTLGQIPLNPRMATARLLTVQPRPEEALRHFSIAEKLALTAEITLSYVRVRWLMQRGDVRATVTAVRRTSAAPSSCAPEFPNRLGGIVEARLRLLPGDTRCLARSLVLLRLLARRGLSGTLVIGVRTEPAFGAHAWVELDGRALLNPIEATGSRLIEL
jgi:hypothetical protein